MKIYPKTIFRYLSVLLLPVLIMACSGKVSESLDGQPVEESAILLQYLEENGDLINTAPLPFLVEIDELYGSLKSGRNLLIDLRPRDEYLEGHIENSINIQPDKILDYFENRIDPNSFERITLVCSNAQLSGYVVAILRMLGYNNTWHLRFGLSAWNRTIADQAWFAVLSDTLAGKLETTANPKNSAGSLPVINTGMSSPREILHQRARVVLSEGWQTKGIGIGQLMLDTADYYVVCYWPLEVYDSGHIPGSVHYLPRQSFKSTADIKTLPTDKPVVIYCYTGQTSSYATAFLNLLGYDARNLKYGANSFTYSIMRNTPPATRAFSEEHIRNYPLVKGNEKSGNQPVMNEKTEQITVKGGC